MKRFCLSIAALGFLVWPSTPVRSDPSASQHGDSFLAKGLFSVFSFVCLFLDEQTECILALALVPGQKARSSLTTPTTFVQPTGSCSVSERPADGGAAEFSRGLVPAKLAEGWGAGGKTNKTGRRL